MILKFLNIWRRKSSSLFNSKIEQFKRRKNITLQISSYVKKPPISISFLSLSSIIIFIVIHIFNCNNIANVFKTWHISQWRGVDRIRGGKNNCVIMQTPSSLKNIDSAIKITSHKLHFPDLTRTTSRSILFCRYFSKFQPMPQCCGIWRRYKAEEPVSECSPTAVTKEFDLEKIHLIFFSM